MSQEPPTSVGCFDLNEAGIAKPGGLQPAVRVAEPRAASGVCITVTMEGRPPLLAACLRLIAFGEVGLAGEVRPVPGINQRIHEAQRLGFTHAIVPASPNGPGPVPEGFSVREVAHVAEALELLIG